MTDITFKSANKLFSQKKYFNAFDHFSHLAKNNANPAFCSFMAGKCLNLSNKNADAYFYFQKALEYDDSNAFINREIERFIIAHKLIDQNKKVLYHYFPNTTNIGDSGAAAGIRALFHSRSKDFFFFTLSCRKDTFDSLQAYDINPSGMIIGGGGLFFKQPLPSGWYFPLSLSQLTNINVPIITYSIGFNKEFTNEKMWNLDNDFINVLVNFHRQFSLKSVRDNWTKKTLESAGVSDLHLVPCPSAFLKPLPWFKMSIDTSKEVVGLSITDRSLRKDQKVQLLSVIFKFAKWLSEENFFPLFILQDSADDISLAKLITKNRFACILPNTAREAITVYSQCSYVVGMRGHSLILSAGKVVPGIGISYNKKVDAFMEMLGHQEYCINQYDIYKRNALVNIFEKLLVNKSVTISNLKIKRDLFYNLNLEYSKMVVKLLGNKQ